MNKGTGYEQYHQLETYKTDLSTEQIKALRDPVVHALNFIQQHKYQISQNEYQNLFQQYQHIWNIYNNMIDRNIIQSKYNDNRTIVQTQPIIDGPPDYDIPQWQKAFTANNLNVIPSQIPPVNTFRQVKDYNKQQQLKMTMNGY
jgi:hemoglobin-like flavoprotein